MKKINQIILLFSLFITCSFYAMTPLYQAAEAGDLEQVKRILEESANINAVTQFGLTPLQCADRSGNLAIFNFLSGLPKARKEQMFAFLRATHSSNSPAKVLYRDALYLIWKLVKPTTEELDSQLQI